MAHVERIIDETVVQTRGAADDILKARCDPRHTLTFYTSVNRF
jgi:hypothetical protein